MHFGRKKRAGRASLGVLAALVALLAQALLPGAAMAAESLSTVRVELCTETGAKTVVIGADGQERKSGFAGFGEAAFFFYMACPQKRDANRYKEDQNMPIIHVSETGKQDTRKKRDFMEFAANSICSHTNTLPKNIYVYFHEMEPENVRKTAPTARID